jgi:hypothetical protein
MTRVTRQNHRLPLPGNTAEEGVISRVTRQNVPGNTAEEVSFLPGNTAEWRCKHRVYRHSASALDVDSSSLLLLLKDLKDQHQGRKTPGNTAFLLCPDRL